MGIDRAVAVAFAREGAAVAINYLPAEQRDVDDTIGWVRDAGRVGAHVQGDLMQREFCEQVVAAAVAALGGLDILVDNAGYHWPRDPEGLDGLLLDHVERTLLTNLPAII